MKAHRAWLIDSIANEARILGAAYQKRERAHHDCEEAVAKGPKQYSYEVREEEIPRNDFYQGRSIRFRYVVMGDDEIQTNLDEW